MKEKSVLVVGGGPAGLMAAEVLAQAGCPVELFEALPSVGRKFLLAGRGGLNLTHAEAQDDFLARYGDRRPWLEPMLGDFGAAQLRAWAQGLGVETFVGSSGRVFPREMKAAPLLRAWLQRLRQLGVRIHVRHRWLGGLDVAPEGLQRLVFSSPEGEHIQLARAVVFALGGGSWARFGADGAWIEPFRAAGVEVAPLRPANCGFEVAGGWSEYLRQHFAGAPLKNLGFSFVDRHGVRQQRIGECVLTEQGLEGGLLYAYSAALRDRIEAEGQVEVFLDLLPNHDVAWVARELAHPRGRRSLATHWKSRLGIHGVQAALLHEVLPAASRVDSQTLANAIKALPLVLAAPRPLEEAISCAGGVRFEGLDSRLMLQSRPGVFCAGEMLDWEAPTGGYLLSACFATGRTAAQGVLDWLAQGKAKANAAA